MSGLAVFRMDAWIDAARDDESMPPSTKLLALILGSLNKLRSDPLVNPSYLELAEWMGCSQATVYRAMRDLLHRRYVVKVKAGGRTESTTWQLTISEGATI